MTVGPDGPSSAVPDGPSPEPGTEPGTEPGAAAEVRSSVLADAIGGPRGILDTGLPGIVFVVVNAASSLTPAIYAALAFGVALVALRLLRKEPIQQAVSGFIGIGIAAIFASRTHSAKGFFLPGILTQAFLAVASAVSILIRRPYIGYVMAALETSYSHWRTEPALVRAMTRATAIWVFVFTLRAVVQGALYAANHPGWLAVVNIAMGWPLFAGALSLSYLLARRAAAGLPPVVAPEPVDG